MIGSLAALALLALVLAPVVALHQLGAVEAKASIRIVNMGSVRVASFDALLVATRF